jgi:AbiV
VPRRLLGSVLHRHNARHQSAFWDFFVTYNIELMQRLRQEIDLKYQAPTPSEQVAIRAEWFERLTTEIAGLAAHTPESHPALAGFDWIAQAETRKQQAFYVDFVEGEWRSPSQVSATVYDRGAKFTTNFLEVQRSRIEFMLDAPPDIRTNLRLFADEAFAGGKYEHAGLSEVLREAGEGIAPPT